MLGWFQNTCPLDPHDQQWVDDRMAWLSREFGRHRMLGAAVVLPTLEFFPDRYDGSREAVELLLKRLCGYMQIDPSRVHLKLYAETGPLPASPLPANSLQHVEPDGAAGLYQAADSRMTIWLETSRLVDPATVAATLAHELGHVHLLGERRITADAPDHEPLTDLVTMFFGLGILTANSPLRDRSWRQARVVDFGTITREGHLTSPVLAYALALVAWNRGELKPAWARHVRLDVRVPFRKCLRYLEKAGGPRAWADMGRTAANERQPIYEPTQEARAQIDPAGPEAHVDEALFGVPLSADWFFGRGVLLVAQYQWEQAIHEFSEAIRLAPDDGEIYQNRGAALLRLGRWSEALADSEAALRFDPAGIDAYGVRTEAHRVRGHARVGLKEYEAAIADFDCVLSEEAKDADAYYGRGLARAGIGDYRRAEADFTKSIRHGFSRAEAYLARSLVYDRLGKMRRALADRTMAEFLAQKQEQRK